MRAKNLTAAKTEKTVQRSSNGLRETLFDTLDSLIMGEIEVAEAKTRAKVADSILKSVALDLEYQRLVREIAATDGTKASENLKLDVVLVK